MPYIQFDLDAMAVVPDVADAAGVPISSVGWGLVKMWRACWTAKSDRVDGTQLTGFFGGGDPVRVGAALESFGFVEAVHGGDEYRVRGADKYLRIDEARKRGGHASKGNLKRGRKSPAPAGKQPETSRETPPAPPPAPAPAEPQLLHRASSIDSFPSLPPGWLSDEANRIWRKVRSCDFPWGRDPFASQRELLGRAGGDEREAARRIENAASVPRGEFPYAANAASVIQHYDFYDQPWSAAAPKSRGPAASAADKDWSRPVETYIDENGNERLA